MVSPTVPANAEENPQEEEEERSPSVEEWVQLPLRVAFAAGSHDIDAEYQALLREVFTPLVTRTDILRIRVEAYTYSEDDPENDLALSRAQAVIDFLVEDLGMLRDLFETIDRGDGHWEAHHIDSVVFRRVEFRVFVRRQR